MPGRVRAAAAERSSFFWSKWRGNQVSNVIDHVKMSWKHWMLIGMAAITVMIGAPFVLLAISATAMVAPMPLEYLARKAG